MQKTCEHCRKPYNAEKKTNKYCSQQCYINARNENHTTRGIAHTNPADRFPKVQKTCVICGKTFTGATTALSCSKTCQTIQHRKVAREHYQATRSPQETYLQKENDAITHIVLTAWRNATDPIIKKELEYRNPDIQFN